MKNYIRHILLPVFVGLFIFIVTCLISSNDVPDMPTGIPWDKMAHFGMFLVLSAVCLFDYYRLHRGKPNVGKWIFWGFVLPVIYGGGIELMQKYFFPTRGAEWGDFIANMLGSLTALIIALFLYNKFGKREKKVSL
ncbi:MAG: VanZ family protein [Bacteroidia bacterium]|nr:VanZ family protein [Bacteroidia bacterium]